MNKIAFFYAIIILCVIQLASFVFIANLHSWLGKYTIGGVRQLYSPDSVELFESASLALLLIGVTGFVTFVSDSLLVQKKANTKGTFHKFYLPIIEELFKFGLVYFVAYRSRDTGHLAGLNETIHEDSKISKDASHLGVKQIAIIVLVFNFVKFCLFTYRFSPMNYEKDYEEFISFHRMWREHITIYRALRTNNEVKVDAAMILAGSLNDGERSLYSKKSTATFINPPEAISIPSRVPSFDASSLNFKKLPSFKSDMVSADLESCYNLVDKLYSISPKNTYHLDTDDVIVVSIDDLEDDEDPLKSIANNSNNTLNYNGHHSEQNSFQQEGGKEENNFTQSSDLNFERHTCCIASQNDKRSYDTSPSWTSQFISKINFFAWLLPFLSIPQKSEELNNHTRPLANNRKFDPEIKYRLSSYQLDRNSVTDTETLHSSEALHSQYRLPISNYGAIDLESQTSADALISSICLNERNNINDFQLFVDNYFGYTYDPSQISIDPMFETFGVTITEFSAKLFIVLFSCNYVWNISTFLIYAYPFFNDSFLHFYFMILSILIIKLFNQNFIHNKDLRKSVKFSLVVELLINLTIFVGIILLLLFGIDYT